MVGVTESKRIGLLATFLYVVTGFVWFGSVFNAGLYANFYGILSILLIFILVPVVLKSPRNPLVWVAFAVAIGNGYLSHYSFVTIIPALAAIPVAVLILERRFSWPHVAIPLALLAPAGIVVAFRPELVGLMLQFVQAQGGGSINGNTSLSQALTGWPVLRFVVVEITNDVASVIILVLASAGGYFALRGRKPLAWIVVVWLIALLAVAPLSDAAWRFSYMALVPILVLACYAIDWMTPVLKPPELRRSKMRPKRYTRRYRLGFLGIVFILLVVNSWSWSLVGDARSTGGPTGETQRGILASMEWMNSTLPRPSNVDSVTDFDYSYFYFLYSGRNAGYAPLVTPDEVVAASSGSSVPVYAILTEVGTFGGIPSGSQSPFSLFSSDSRFNLVYNESGVVIYQLKG